ncbi:MAG: MotA/TolQ/ExbB proton channel family protein, partial [Lachnospiraceae bacterium]|nr:MotA/TolQ/ExbB proton channel family protein [Lachnospiraceae bacterium]
PQSDDAAPIKSIIELSNIARKEGLLALEEAANELEDEFMKKGILLIVDGTDPEMVRSIMENEMICIEDRHKKVIGFYDNVASMGPAWGMIGTLIGLINMLKNLQDISSVGPNMSTALVTTFYGSLLANWVATPVANKLRLNNSTEIMLKEVMIEGLLSIQAGENPRVIEEKLKSFLSPQHRNALTEGDGDAEAIGGGE